MIQHRLPSRRALVALAIVVLSGTALVQWYGPHVPVCYEPPPLQLPLVLLLPAAFSLGVFWLATEILFWVIIRATRTTRAATPLILSLGMFLLIGLGAFWGFPASDETGAATRALFRLPLWPAALVLQEIDWVRPCTPH